MIAITTSNSTKVKPSCLRAMSYDPFEHDSEMIFPSRSKPLFGCIQDRYCAVYKRYFALYKRESRNTSGEAGKNSFRGFPSFLAGDVATSRWRMHKTTFFLSLG